MGDTKFRQTRRRTAAGPYRADERKRRQTEAIERNTTWQALDIHNKVKSLIRRRGNSKRQLAKIQGD